MESDGDRAGTVSRSPQPLPLPVRTGLGLSEVAEAAGARTRAFCRISRALVANRELRGLLEGIMDEIAKALPSDMAHLMALDTERHLVTGHYLGGPRGRHYTELDYAELMEGLGGWVLTHGATAISSGNGPDPRESPRVRARRARVRLGPMMVAPVSYDDRPLGIIVASRATDQPEFDQADADLLTAMAGQAAVAIESAAVHEQLQAAHRELKEHVAERTTQLAESEHRYRRITESITDYMYRVVVAGGVATATEHGPGCVAVTGYTSEEFEADPGLWLRMVVPEDRAMVLEQTADVEANRLMRPAEHRIVRKDGSLRWVRSTRVPQYGVDGTLVGYDGLLQDITERRTLEEQLIQAQKMESIGRLAGGVAHDFNNLLTAIMGNAELALLDLGADNPTRANIAEIVKAADGAARLTSQLLAFARKQIIQPASLDLSALVAGLPRDAATSSRRRRRDQTRSWIQDWAPSKRTRARSSSCSSTWWSTLGTRCRTAAPSSSRPPTRQSTTSTSPAVPRLRREPTSACR